MLKIINISKEFPGVKALQDVSIEFNSGEVHALLGENGAGKSTLIKIISGVYKQDNGQISFNDEIYSPKNTLEALCKGIHTVYQDLQVVPEASVAENIMLDKLPNTRIKGFVNWKMVNSNTKKYLEMVGLDIAPTTIIKKISIAQRQLVEIAKALASNTKVLLLDEPTSSLTENESETLFKIVNKLKEKGVIVIFVTHILEEVFRICDRVSILRDGKCVVIEEIKNLNRKKIIKHMIGRDENTKPFGNLDVDKKKKVLEVNNLTRENKAYDVNFHLNKGEILGFYGLVGSGRTELAKILIGIDKYDSGEILINNERARVGSVSQAMRKYKIGYVTEDRRKDGLLVRANVKTNICMTIWENLLNKAKLVSRRMENDEASKQVNNLDMKITSLNQKVANLSGGNQQKVNISKMLSANMEIIIFDEPTVGIDIGAREYIAKLIWDLANNKKSIILISSDMPEIIRIATRILVFSGKKIVGEVDNSSKNYKEVSGEIGNLISEYSAKEA